jgi:chromate transporter
VGVILNLAVVFGATVLLPRGVSAGPDWFAVAVTIAAVVAVFRLKLDIVWVVLLGGLVGMSRLLFS